MPNLTVMTCTYTENDIYDGEISSPWKSDDMPLRLAYAFRRPRPLFDWNNGNGL